MSKEFQPTKLKEKREDLHLTHLDLAFRCTSNGHRITPQTIQNWEAGKSNPFPRLLAKVAEALGVNLEYFYKS